MSREQWLLRGLVAAGTMVAFIATGVAHVLLATVLAAAMALTWALVPESGFGATAIGYVLLTLALGRGHDLSSSALVVAAGLVVAHVAALLASYVPDRAAPDAAVVRLWTLRGLVTLLVAAVAFVVAAAVGDQGTVIWGAAAAVAVAGAIGGLVVVRRMGGNEW